MPVHDVMREWLLSEDEHQHGQTRPGAARDGDDPDFARLRETAIVSDPDLWLSSAAACSRWSGSSRTRLADDLDIEPDSLQAQIVGESTVAVLLAINARAARTGTAAMDEFDVAFDFMRTRLMADAI